MSDARSNKKQISRFKLMIAAAVAVAIFGGLTFVWMQFDLEGRASAMVVSRGGTTSIHALRPGWVPDDVDDAWFTWYERIVVFDLSGSAVTDDDLTSLEGLIYLTRLNLDNTSISDAGLVHLVEARYLADLSLSGTSITDAGLKHLASCRKLQSLNIENTRVTARGVKELQAALPQCHITWTSPSP